MENKTILALQKAKNRNAAISVLTKQGWHSQKIIKSVIEHFGDQQKSEAQCTPEIMKTISKVKEPIIRNLQITQAYHDLTIGMTKVIGYQNVSWVGYACWASKTAGKFIRDEEIPAALHAALDRHYKRDNLFEELTNLLTRFLGDKSKHSKELVKKYLQDSIDDVANNIAKGNLKVFAEVGPIFAEAVQIFSKDASFSKKNIDAFCKKIHPGETKKNGQEHLQKAFRYYYQARFEKDHKKKAELILLANILVGFHEQIRLQSAIQEAFDAPFKVDGGFTEEFIKELQLLFPSVTHRFIPAAVRLFLGHFEKKLEKVWEHIMTEFMMTITIPGETLRLGEDIPQWPDGSMFPPQLKKIEYPALRKILKNVHDEDSLAESHAVYWNVLNDRMHFIGDLFRTHNQNALLFLPPFTKTQTQAIYAQKLPAGKL